MGVEPPTLAPSQREPRHILIVKPSSLGDVVHALPAVARVRERWPRARLSWIINPEWAPLLEGNPDVDQVIIFPRREFRGIAGMKRLWKWSREIRRELQADLVLDLQGLLRSGFISRLAVAKGGTIVGLSDAREGSRFFYSRTVSVNPDAHSVERYLAGAGAVGADSATQGLRWNLPLGIKPDEGLPEDFLLLHPFSRGEGKSLPVEDVVAFCSGVAPQPVVLVGRGTETVPSIENCCNLLNRTSIQQLIWLLRKARFVVSVDSGPMHIAAALTPELVGIHTWSDPHSVGPFRDEAWVWKDQRLGQFHGYREGNSSALPIAGIRELAGWVRNRTDLG